MPTLLEDCAFPHGIKNLSSADKKILATEVREKIIQTVAKNGGHLAPSLGTVELTIALLSVFNPSEDKIIWDVGHQAYAWKILTDRRDSFHTLRTYKGISGFTKPSESPYDHFIAGHASTSISAALGKAYARDLMDKDNHVIAVIGDGSLTGGMAFEALNQAGELGKQLIVILNDNNMSISPNVGAFSEFVSSNLSKNWVLRIKKAIRDFCYNHLSFGRKLLNFFKKGEQSFKVFFTPGSLFEAFDFNYIGPVDGHNTDQIIQHLKTAISAQKLNQPILLHLKTKKGKGYTPAEVNPSIFHGVSPFDPTTGIVHKSKSNTPTSSATDALSKAIVDLAAKDEKIIAITAAMLQGTGLSEFSCTYPERCIDVGICEQHAVTFAAGLASEGFKPVIAMYSTFLQRAYDQIIHDVCLQNLHVIFCIDRAGLVGEDGPTHHGVFDLSFLRTIPNMRIIVPANPTEIADCLATALAINAPIALRYPRGKAPYALPKLHDYTVLEEGLGEFIYPEIQDNSSKNEKSCIIAIGAGVDISLKASADFYVKNQILTPIFNARWVKPLPLTQLDEIAQKYEHIIIVEENTLVGGFSSAIIEYYSDSKQIQKLSIDRVALPDEFIEHGAVNILKEKHKFTSEQILALLIR